MCVQDLVARGLVNPGQGLSLARGNDDGDTIYREVTINDAAPNLRHHLTKRSTQDDISKRTKASIVVRGRFMPPGSQEGEEKPLFLKCTPGLSRQEVRNASADRCVCKGSTPAPMLCCCMPCCT